MELNKRGLGLHCLLDLVAPASHDVRVGLQQQEIQRRKLMRNRAGVPGSSKSSSVKLVGNGPIHCATLRPADSKSTSRGGAALGQGDSGLPGRDGCLRRVRPMKRRVLVHHGLLQQRSICPRRPPSVMRHSTRIALALYRSVLLFMSFISELVTMMTWHQAAGTSKDTPRPIQ